MKSYKQIKTRLNKNVFMIALYIVSIIIIASILIQLLTADSQKSFFGYTFRIVVSGSMEPTINTNAIAIIKTCDINELNVGDVICFNYGQDIIHRVINKNSDGIIILNTQGDANEMPDGVEITSDMVIGKVVRIFNEVAPFITKYSISPGNIDSLTLARNVTVGCIIFVLAIYIIIHVIKLIINFIISLIHDKSEELKKDIIEQYITDIDELILYREILKDALNEEVKNNAENRFHYLGSKIARAKLQIECKTLHYNIKDYKNQVKKAVFIQSLGKSLDNHTNDEDKKVTN